MYRKLSGIWHRHRQSSRFQTHRSPRRIQRTRSSPFQLLKSRNTCGSRSSSRRKQNGWCHYHHHRCLTTITHTIDCYPIWITLDIIWTRFWGMLFTPPYIFFRLVSCVRGAQFFWWQYIANSATLKDIPDDGVQDEIRAKLLEIILANVESDPDTAAALASELEYLPLNDIIQLSN